MKERALAYVRVSTVRQSEEGNSISSQIATVVAYAKLRGLKLISNIDIIIEDGVSASIPLWDRKNGERLLEKIESGKYQHLIVTKLDRMFRITSDAVLTIDEFKRMGIGLHVINMGGSTLDTTNPMGRFILTFVASASELERGLITERTREAMQYLRKRGMKFTRSLYGWDVNSKGKLIPNWEEQGRIDFMCWQILRNEVSATKVAQMMNKRNWEGKLGGSWAAQTVINVTQNKFHINRRKFKMPTWYGDKTWHRKIPERNQRDEKVKMPKTRKVWSKKDI